MTVNATRHNKKHNTASFMVSMYYMQFHIVYFFACPFMLYYFNKAN